MHAYGAPCLTPRPTRPCHRSTAVQASFAAWSLRNVRNPRVPFASFNFKSRSDDFVDEHVSFKDHVDTGEGSAKPAAAAAAAGLPNRSPPNAATTTKMAKAAKSAPPTRRLRAQSWPKKWVRRRPKRRLWRSPMRIPIKSRQKQEEGARRITTRTSRSLAPSLRQRRTRRSSGSRTRPATSRYPAD